MKKALKIIGIMLVLGFIANCGGDRDHLLRYNVEDGDSYNLTFTMSMEGLLTIEMNMGSTLDIISTNDNEIVTRTSFNSISMDMSMSGESVSYDSRNPYGSEFSNLMHKNISPMLSAKLETTINDRGRVLKAPDLASIFDNNPNLQAQMSDMTKQMENMFVEYPEEALKIGDSFDVQLDNEGMSIAAVYTLTGVTVTEYILSVNGDIASSDELAVTGTMTGTQTFFRESCMPKSSDMTVRMEVSGMTMTMETSMEVEKY